MIGAGGGGNRVRGQGKRKGPIKGKRVIVTKYAVSPGLDTSSS